MIARNASRLSCSCFAIVAGFVLSICRVFNAGAAVRIEAKRFSEEIRAGCRIFPGTCTVGEDVRLPPDPEMSRPVGMQGMQLRQRYLR